MWPSALPSAQPLGALDTNPKVKNPNKGQSAVPLSHSNLEGWPKGPTMTTIARQHPSWSKSWPSLPGVHLKVHWVQVQRSSVKHDEVFLTQGRTQLRSWVDRAWWLWLCSYTNDDAIESREDTQWTWSSPGWILTSYLWSPHKGSKMIGYRGSRMLRCRGSKMLQHRGRPPRHPVMGWGD